MTDITPERRNIVIEEVDFKSGIAERTYQKIGGSTNFINERHFELKQWLLNFNYTEVEVDGLDGVWPVPIDMEILFFSMSNVVSGISGTTEVDLELLTSPGVSGGSIFSTTPKITSAASNKTYLIKDMLVPANNINPAGTTLPVFSTTTLLKGQALSCNLLQSMVQAETVAIQIMYRPV